MIIGNYRRNRLGKGALGLAACLLTLGMARSVAAQDAPAAAPPPPDPDKVTLNFFKGTEIGGLVDGYYEWYSTKQNGLYRAFDQSQNAFTVSMAEVWLAKTASSDSPVGYKIRMNFGEASHVYTPAADSDFKYIEEAYGSFLVPAGKGLTIDFGKFVTNAGAEVVEAKDNWNYTRSLLFQLAIPVYHAGLRVNYAPSDKVSFMVGVVNGWNNVVENNTGKSFMASVTLKPNANFSFIENYIVGPEEPGTNNPVRNLSDTVLSFTASPKLSLMGNFDFVGEGGANAQGIAGYLKYQANKVVALVPRYEYYNDGDGFSTGTPQKLQDFTVTLEVKGADNFLWRIEYRGDYSDKFVFKTDTLIPKKNQQSLAFGFLYSFSSKS